MNGLSKERCETLRRWWRRLPLDHPFVDVIRQLTGEQPDTLYERVPRGSRPPGKRRDGETR